MNVAAQEADPDSMLSAYRALLEKRSESEALTQGEMVPVATPLPTCAGFLRKTDSESVLVALNFDGQAATCTFDLEAAGIWPTSSSIVPCPQ